MAGLAAGRGVAAAIGAALALLAIAGCDLRRETPPPVWPTPDAATAARDSLADASQAVIDATEREKASGPDAGFAPSAAHVAGTHLDALGGVYVAYPGAAASPTANPSAAPPEPTLAEAIEQARLAAQGAIASGDPELTSLGRAIDLEWALRWALTVRPQGTGAGSADTRVPFPLAQGGADKAASFAPQAGTSVGADALAALAVAHDHARFAYETIAAWEAGAEREAALAQAETHARFSDDFAALLEDDPRTALYQLRDADLPNPASRRALELSMELEIALLLVAELDGSTQADAAWLLNAAFDAFTRAGRLEGFAASDIPALPGIRVVDAAA